MKKVNVTDLIKWKIIHK